MEAPDESDGGGAARWFLLTGDRLVIAGGALAAVFVALLAVLLAFGFSVLRPGSPMYFLFSSLLTGDLTLLTVVLSINQLVVSREIAAPGTLRERIEDALDYRSSVENATDEAVSPQSPPNFLRYLHENVERRAEELREAAERIDDEESGNRLESLADSLLRDARTVNGTLESEETDVFTVVAATISTNHAAQLHEIARLRDECADAVPEDVESRLERIRRNLLQIDVARQYFKTVYVQKELAYLSRILLYIGVPAIVAGGLALVFYNAASIGVAPRPLFLGVVVVGFTLGFAPLTVLFSFVLRLAWVAQRTVAVTPFSATGGYSP